MMFTIPEVFVDYPNPISVTHVCIRIQYLDIMRLVSIVYFKLLYSHDFMIHGTQPDPHNLMHTVVRL